MGETVKTEKAPKTSFFDGLKAEYKKIIWPDQKTVTKQTIAVVSVSVALGVREYVGSKLVCGPHVLWL